MSHNMCVIMVRKAAFEINVGETGTEWSTRAEIFVSCRKSNLSLIIYIHTINDNTSGLVSSFWKPATSNICNGGAFTVKL